MLQITLNEKNELVLDFGSVADALEAFERADEIGLGLIHLLRVLRHDPDVVVFAAGNHVVRKIETYYLLLRSYDPIEDASKIEFLNSVYEDVAPDEFELTPAVKLFA